jgi:hypothetical protein
MPEARRLLLALSAAAAAGGLLAACPIPQPLPGVGNTDAGVTPPRILVDGVHPGAALIAYDDAPGACDGGPLFEVRATVLDQNPDDVVEGRWFIDYSESIPWVNSQGSFTFTVVLPGQTTQDASFPFAPKTNGNQALSFHLVELVVSNGFAAVTPDGGLPNRSPRPGYETALYRWVFQPVPGSAADGGCGP